MERKWIIMQLIDGYNGGVAHITASMIRDHNLSMYGTDDCVLEVGNKFLHEIVNNNLIRIKDGMAIIGGARAIIEYGQQETAVIENGVSGYKRNDLIVIEYNKDNETLKETTTLKVVKGTLGSDGVDPTLVAGDIRSGATQRQMALYRVRLDGLSIEGVDTLWKAANCEKMLSGIGLETKTLLWENASPSSNFTAQTIIADASQYDAIMVECGYSTTGLSITESARISRGTVSIVAILGGYNKSGSNIHIRGRGIKFNDNGSIESEDAHTHRTNDTTGSVDNQYMIPLRIYGIKGVM